MLRFCLWVHNKTPWRGSAGLAGKQFHTRILLNKQMNESFIYEKANVHIYYSLETDVPALQGAHTAACSVPMHHIVHHIREFFSPPRAACFHFNSYAQIPKIDSDPPPQPVTSTRTREIRFFPHPVFALGPQFF